MYNIHARFFQRSNFQDWFGLWCLTPLSTIENPGPGLSMAQICGGVELVNNGIPLPLEN
jgi:hypothetical protein